VRIAVVVAHARAVDIEHGASGQEGVRARGRRQSAQGRQDPARLDDRIQLAVERAREGAAQGGVQPAGLVRAHEREAARGRVGLRADLLEQRDLLGSARQEQRAAGAQPDLGSAAGELQPAQAAAQRDLELTARAPARDPQQPEAAHGRAARLGVALDVCHLMPPLDRGQGESGADDAGTDDHQTRHLNPRGRKVRAAGQGIPPPRPLRCSRGSEIS
jgi:hypothetical protein